MQLFNTPTDSPEILIITIIYFISSSIETFDIRLIQARKQGLDVELLPWWTGLFIYLCWILFVALVLLNWKYAIIVYVIRFILKVLPVLETVGNILMAPLKWKKK